MSQTWSFFLLLLFFLVIAGLFIRLLFTKSSEPYKTLNTSNSCLEASTGPRYSCYQIFSFSKKKIVNVILFSKCHPIVSTGVCARGGLGFFVVVECSIFSTGSNLNYIFWHKYKCYLMGIYCSNDKVNPQLKKIFRLNYVHASYVET